MILKVHELFQRYLGWLCPKPKDPENNITLDGLRPLMLLEVLRKLWIHIRKIVRLWEVYRALTPSQHGFRRGHGTDSALMVLHLNCFEHGQRSTEYPPGLRFSVKGRWRRLSVPAATAHWIAHLDDHGTTAVRSPRAREVWRKAAYQGLGTDISPVRPGTFLRERGIPQGDVSSPQACTGPSSTSRSEHLR